MKIIGLGFRRQATLGSLLDALSQLEQALHTVDALASSVAKSQAVCLQELACALDLGIVAIQPDELAAQITPTQSARQRALFGTGSLAEAAALAAAGPGAQLVVCRKVSADGNATAAIAVALSTTMYRDKSYPCDASADNPGNPGTFIDCGVARQ